MAKWRPATPDDRERLTIPLCRKHLERLRKGGDKGRDIKGFMYKVGWW